MNIEDKAPLTGNFNRPDLLLVVVDQSQSPTPDGNQGRTIQASELFNQMEQGREAIPYEVLTSLTWNVIAQPRVYLDLTADLAHIVTKGAGEGLYFQIHVRQPQSGGKKITIDGVPIQINRTGNTMVLAQYIGGVLDIHTDASAEAGKPVLLDESGSQTVLEGEYAEVWAKFAGADEYYIERNGKPVLDATGAAYLVKVTEDTAGGYEVIGKNEYGETRSAAKFIKPGEAEAVYVKTQPQSITLPAGNEFELTAEFGGTPPPSVACFLVVNGVRTTQVATGSKFKGVSIDTAKYQFVGTNSFKVPVIVTPAVLGPDGITVITPAVTELQKKVFTAESDIVTVTPEKQTATPPVVTVDDVTVQSFLYTQLIAGTTLSNYKGTLDVSVDEPTLAALTLVTVNGIQVVKLLVGDVNLPVGKAGIAYTETKTHYASPFATNNEAFTGSLIAAPTNLVADANKYQITWTESVDALDTPTQEYRINGGAWVDTSESKATLTENIPAGGFEAREKARLGKPASASLTNTVAINLPAYFITGTLKTLNDTARDYYHDETTPDKIKESDELGIIVVTSGPNPGVFNTKDVQENWQSTGKNIFQAAKGIAGNDSGPGAGQVVTGMAYKLVRSSSSGNDFSGKNLCTYGPDGNYFYDKQSPVNLTKALNALVKVGYSLSGRKREDLYRCTQAVSTYGINVMQLESYQGSPALPGDLYGATWEIVNP